MFQVSSDGNVTTSKLTLVPTVEDNGKRLTCRADNRNVAAGAEEDSIELNVYCKFFFKSDSVCGISKT